MAVRLCLVDGTYELFRAFYSAPSALASDGQEIGASLQLARSLRALTESGEWTHFAIAFDTVIESFRNELFGGYKTGEGIEPSLFSQFPIAEEVSRALGWFTMSMREFEADDGIATLAASFGSRSDVEKIVIASPDKDLMQCVLSNRITTWDRVRDVRYDAEGVLKKMGVTPSSIPDYLALVGDTADGIPGVPRFGAKSAASLLLEYETLENIPLDEAEWKVKLRGAAALGANLREHREAAALYKVLATLRRDALAIPSIEELVVAPQASLLERLTTRLGRPLFKSKVSSSP